ncbi:MAG TPA: GNAT family N-acetyltransferase [Dongiaceae bacterium]|jgi:RimJ/RimL family protein N-acetyltransferase|nr:GNAT family N-acetyltransferase [Dongiaceae bacterium]
MPFILRTPRLILRGWRDEDSEPFAAMFNDPAVMEFLLPSAGRGEIDAFIGRIKQHFADHEFGLWAVEVPGVAPFIGWVGLSIPRFEAHFMPAVEIGWRLASAYWGQGYATEGARAALEAGFTRFGLAEIVSFAVPANLRSIHVMQRIGMRRDPEGDFDHPRVPDGSPLKRHVLYRIARARWEEMSERH